MTIVSVAVVIRLAIATISASSTIFTSEDHNVIFLQSISIVNLTISATAKIVYNADLQVFDNPTEETEEFLAAIKLISNSIFKLLIEPPFFKLYRNKVYRDIEKGFTVGSHHV